MTAYLLGLMLLVLAVAAAAIIVAVGEHRRADDAERQLRRVRQTLYRRADRIVTDSDIPETLLKAVTDR